MELTILGSGGCMVIPKPLCKCPICAEARERGEPYRRTGPSAFLHDENLLIDTPAEIVFQLNRAGIQKIETLLFSHLDPDHVEGFRVVEQIALDFRSWEAYPDKSIRLALPEALDQNLGKIRSIYGSLVAFYEKQGFIKRHPFREKTRIGKTQITAIGVNRGEMDAFIYVLEKGGKRLAYAPCDIRPFPEEREELNGLDLLVIQPGIFETGLKHGFKYPEDHISRTTLYTFEETLELGKRIQASQLLFIHLEEYWNRSYDDYKAIEAGYNNVRFAFDGMTVTL
jgi:phosphoribosyl 1,2-cyclic phosphate phosphodiesterase